MSDDKSNDVVMVESNEEDSSASKEIEPRPLMQLFHRLISNDNKQNTVLTNAQIISILDKEFDIQIATLHDLEVDIYLNVVKKFLKDWPLWDEFDRGINALRKQKAFKSIKRTLESKYVNLKEYLSVQLEATKPKAQEALQKMLGENAKKMEQVNTSDVLLEVFCTRRQFNELIYSHPFADPQNNIFNILDHELTSISLKNLPMEAVLNWFHVKIAIDLKPISFTRSTMHQFKHTLINKRNGPRDLKISLEQKIQIKDTNWMPTYVKKEKICSIFDSIVDQNRGNSLIHSLLKPLFNVVKNDLELFKSDIPIPGTFRQFTNKFPYYRKLYKEQKTMPMSSSAHLYDLYIEETSVPMNWYHFGKIASGPVILTPNLKWLTIECGQCNAKFNGIDCCTLMKEHFDMYHANEPDWTCTNCEKSFSMMYLTMNKWYHDCDSSN